MAKLSRTEREAIAEKRLLSVLAAHDIANARTLEQKISDAGPYGQRIDPHILTPVRNRMVEEAKLGQIDHVGTPWFYLPNKPEDVLLARLEEQAAVHSAYTAGTISLRVGQALEIAVYRALCSIENSEFYGRYKDLDAHDDGSPYAKEEPPQHIGSLALHGDERLDYIIRHPAAGHLGIECKNVRSWLYPDRDEITDAIRKCIAINCVPVLIGRRIPYVTFSLLSRCGVLMH
jgi:hypothetical protein